MVQTNMAGTRASLLRRLALYLFALLAVLLGSSDWSATATATPSAYLNFQGRLKAASGSIAPDGYYNLEFKIYDHATAGSLLWTETRTGVNTVRVVNGYLSVSLGEVNAFGSSVTDWSEQLFITMNVGGTGSPSWDGEMSNGGTRMILTAVPYAFQSDVSNSTRGAVSAASEGGGSNGGMYYNTSLDKFRCYENGAWKDCVGLSSSLTDNVADAWDVQEGSNNYLNIATSNGSEAISFGNTATHPDFNLLGSGTLTVSGPAVFEGNLTVQMGDTLTVGGQGFTDFTGDGLQLSSGALGVDSTVCRDTGNCVGLGGLQGAYDAGNTITTSNARDLDFTLADTATDGNFDIVIATGSTGGFRIYEGATLGLSYTAAHGLNIPGGGATSQQFGYGALAGNNYNLAAGYNAIIGSTTSQSIAVGYNATIGMGSHQSIAIGSDAQAATWKSFAIGYAATSNSTNSMAIGWSASATGSGVIALGYGASTSGAHSDIVIGTGATSTVGSNGGSIALGTSSSVSGVNNSGGIAIGYTSSVSGSHGIAIGRQAVAANGFSIALGYGTTTTANNQLVVGSSSAATSQGYFGNGVTAATPTSITLNATGGSGTDIAGANLTLAGGRGTGTGAGGNIVLQTAAAAGATGSTLNALQTRLTIEQGGNVVVGVSNTIGSLLVLDTKTNVGDPTGVDGGMYYNSNLGKFRCYEAATWKDCIGTGDLVNGGQNGSVTVGTNSANTLTLETNNTARLTITSAGAATFSGTVAYTGGTADTNTAVCQNSAGQLAGCTSSARYKTDVQNSALGLDELRLLQPVTYTWASNGREDVGFIAESVAAVIPQAVTYDSNGEVTSFNPHVITSLLVSSVKQLDLKVEALQDRVAALEAAAWGNLPELRVNGDATIGGNVTFNGKLLTGGDTPDIEAADVDSDGAAEITGNDTAGYVAWRPGDLAEAGKQVIITFDTPYDARPTVSVTAHSEAAGSVRYYAMAGTDGFSIYFLDPPTPGREYVFDYLVVQ